MGGWWSLYRSAAVWQFVEDDVCFLHMGQQGCSRWWRGLITRVLQVTPSVQAWRDSCEGQRTGNCL
jgi:hypothetical protein